MEVQVTIPILMAVWLDRWNYAYSHRLSIEGSVVRDDGRASSFDDGRSLSRRSEFRSVRHTSLKTILEAEIEGCMLLACGICMLLEACSITGLQNESGFPG